MHKIVIALFAAGTATLPLMAHPGLGTLDAFHVIGIDVARQSPPEGWAPQDPADAVWRAGRTAINEREWSRAAAEFKRIRTENDFRASTYRGQSYYWEAYARAQMGGSAQLRQAQTLLEEMSDEFPEDVKKIRDVASLLATVEGRLSKDFGDEMSTAKLSAQAAQLSAAADKLAANVTGALAGRSTRSDGCPDMDNDDNPRVAALNALLQMNSDVAMPILEELIKKREKCSEVLRAKAMFLIGQQNTPRAADILLDAAKNDPDEEVREQAVFWLSQVDSEKAVTALEDILRSSSSESLHENALFALSQNRSPRANGILRDFAARSDISSEVRGNAIHWLGQTGSEANFTFLQNLYGKVTDNEVKEQILFAAAQRNTAASADWLMSIAMDRQQEVEVRKQALFWLAQGGDNKRGGTGTMTSSKLVSLYDTMDDPEMREQLIFVYSQRPMDTVLVDKLMSIAKNDKNPELRKTAIFWLGQVGSKDPRVVKFLLDMING